MGQSLRVSGKILAHTVAYKRTAMQAYLPISSYGRENISKRMGTFQLGMHPIDSGHKDVLGKQILVRVV